MDPGTGISCHSFVVSESGRIVNGQETPTNCAGGLKVSMVAGYGHFELYNHDMDQCKCCDIFRVDSNPRWPPP